MCVVGARPHFVKVAPVLRALHASGRFRPVLVHTGQHYDRSMSEVFFRDLEIRDDPINLAVGSGTHATQTGAVMRALENFVADAPPAIMLTFGDVNSTLAAA